MCLLISTAEHAACQPLSWSQNNKYWSYRNRLVNKFVVRGAENNACSDPSGLSIPAKLAFTHESKIRWADGGAQLGWYISVLATEYQLQVLSGYPSQKTLEELYYAMRAYERLDRKAERLYYPQNPNANCSDNYLNGLFVRDDVGVNSFLPYRQFRDQYMSLDEFGVPFFDMTSDYFFTTTNGALKRNVYPSADQITDLFIGFALVAKCVGNVSYQGYNFRSNAILYADKIASRLSSLSWLGRLENGEKYDMGETFLLENTAYGIAKAAEAITSDVYTQSPVLGLEQVGGWNNYADLVLGPPRMDIYYTHDKDFSTALIQGIAAIGSSWEYGLIVIEKIVEVPYMGVCFAGGIIPYPCLQFVEVPMYAYEVNSPFDFTGVPLGWHPYQLPDLSIDVSSEMLAKYGVDYNQQIFSLLHEYLHEETSAIPNETFTNMIESAPCNGPRHMPSNNEGDLGVDGWRATNRFNRPLNADGWNDHDDAYSAGEFNGMDYMLLHNLYLLTRGGIDTPFKNRLNQTSSETLTNPGNHWSYETLEFNGAIEFNQATAASHVELSSGKSVTLKPGFQSPPGATFHAYTAEYTACNTTVERSSALRKDESKVKQLAVDTLAVYETINKSVQAKITNSINTSLTNSQNQSSYTPLSTYLENRVKEEQLENEDGNTMRLYPNPTPDKLRIALTLEQEQSVQLRLRDINGKELMKLHDGILKKGPNEFNIAVGDLNEGTFLVEVQGEFFSDYQRFVKTSN